MPAPIYSFPIDRKKDVDGWNHSAPAFPLPVFIDPGRRPGIDIHLGEIAAVPA
jgi:hypothetical protein